MSASIARSWTAKEDRDSSILRGGRKILAQESAALATLEDQLDESFVRAVRCLEDCRGRLLLTGIGKAGLVAQKLAATFSSTGTPSHFLHPSEAVHGDLGCVCAEDVVLVLSYSGESEEVVRILPWLRKRASALVCITGTHENQLARSSDICLAIGKTSEAGNLSLAPSCTTTMMMALGDALALQVSELRRFTREDFANYHPAGSLGRQLSFASDLMRPLSECRVAQQELSVREVLISVSCPGRRTGAIMLTDESGKLVGLFTDSDLARLLERAEDQSLNQPVSEVMTRYFQTIGADCRFADITRILSDFKISELPVVDIEGKPVGIVDITDVVGVVTSASSNESDDQPPRILSLRGNA